MKKLTAEQINSVKARGFLLNKGTTKFSGRIVARGTIFSAEDFAVMSRIAENYGDGKLMATSRQCIEISGIEFEDIDKAIAYAEENGLYFGGTGAKVRPVTACKGTTCVFGNIDTHGIAGKIHDEFYIGWKDVKLPHKIKISVGGCPNSCIKPSINDIGIEGHKVPVFDAERCKNWFPPEESKYHFFPETAGRLFSVRRPVLQKPKTKQVLRVVRDTLGHIYFYGGKKT